MEDLVSVLLQKNPDDRPSAKQLLYVPAMQPYVKKFLQCERDRTDSVASDISEISSRSSPDCSQISIPRKIEKGLGEGQVQQNSNVSIGISRGSSSRERRLSSNKAPKEHDKRRASESVPKEQEPFCVADKAPELREPFRASDNVPKAREPIYASGNIPRARENLRTRCPADVRKNSLLALAHAQQRRHSEQNSARSQPGSRISKGRIHSHGAQVREFSESEDDVFSANYPTVIPARNPDTNNVSKAREVKKSVSNTSASQCSSRQSSVAEEKKQKPAMSVCQPKRSEDMRARMRNQSATDKTCHIDGKHRRFTSGSEINGIDKENVSVSC